MFSFTHSQTWAALLIAVSYLTVTTLLLIWAGLGRQHWFWRVMGVLAWFGALKSGGMDELAVLAMLRAGIVLSVLWLIRGVVYWRSAYVNKTFSALQFSLRDMFLLAIPVTLVCVLTHHLYDQFVRLLFYFAYTWRMSPIFAVQALAVAWLGLGRRFLWARILAAALSMALVYYSGFDRVNELIFIEEWISKEIEHLSRELLASVLAITSTLWPALLLFLACGNGLGGGHPLRVRLQFLGAILPAVLVTGWTYWRTIAPPPPISRDYPNPNAYAMARDIYRKWPEDFRDSLPSSFEADLPGVSDLHEMYAADLESLRPKLRYPGKVVLPDDPDVEEPREYFFRVDKLISGFVLLAQGKDDLERARIAIDIMRLGNRLSVGGLYDHWNDGNKAHRIGMNMMLGSLPALGKQDCRSFANEVAVLEREYEPLQVVYDREFNWDLNTSNWYWRRKWAIRDLAGSDPRFDETSIPEEQVHIALLRLLRVELAIRAFALEQKRWPKQLAELAPDYIDEVPRDPFHDQPLAYRLVGDGYRVYSVGFDRVDNGGVPGNSSDLDAHRCDLTLAMVQLDFAEYRRAAAMRRAKAGGRATVQSGVQQPLPVPEK